MQHVITHLAESGPSYDDDVWMVGSAPVECGRSRETEKRSQLDPDLSKIDGTWSLASVIESVVSASSEVNPS